MTKKNGAGLLRVAVPEYSFDGRLEGVLVLALSASSCQELVPILLGLGHLVISLPVPGESSFQHPTVTVQPTVQLQNTKGTMGKFLPAALVRFYCVSTFLGDFLLLTVQLQTLNKQLTCSSQLVACLGN